MSIGAGHGTEDTTANNGQRNWHFVCLYVCGTMRPCHELGTKITHSKIWKEKPVRIPKMKAVWTSIKGTPFYVCMSPTTTELNVKFVLFWGNTNPTTTTTLAATTTKCKPTNNKKWASIEIRIYPKKRRKWNNIFVGQGATKGKLSARICLAFEMNISSFWSIYVTNILYMPICILCLYY